MSLMSRDEHLGWAKQRALEYLDAGDVTNTYVSMGSDLSKHPDLARVGAVMMPIGMRHAINNDSHGMRRWVEGFN